MNTTNLLSSLAIFSVILFSCAEPASNDSAEQTTMEESTVSENSEEMEAAMPSESEFELSLIIANNIAAPVKFLTDMSKEGVGEFDMSLLNPTSNAENYATAQEKALAYGAYGADFSYVAMHNQTDKVADYLVTIDKMSDDLGMTSLFDQQSFERFDRIKEDPDSIKMFIFDKYDQADGFLRENDRRLQAALILTGGVIESLHLVSAQIEAGDASEEAYMVFIEQRNTLKSLIDLYAALENEGQSVSVKTDVEILYAKFQDVNTEELTAKENIEPIHQAIDEVRAGII